MLAGFWHPVGDDPGKQDPGIAGLSRGDVVAGAAGGQTVRGESGAHGSAVGDGSVNVVWVIAITAGAAAVLVVSAPSRTTRHATTVAFQVGRGSHRNGRYGRIPPRFGPRGDSVSPCRPVKQRGRGIGSWVRRVSNGGLSAARAWEGEIGDMWLRPDDALEHGDDHGCERGEAVAEGGGLERGFGFFDLTGVAAAHHVADTAN